MTQLSTSKLSLRKSPPLTNQEFEQLRSFIYSLTGIDIPERRKYLLENRLGKRVSELDLKSFSEYYQFLKHSPQKKEELEQLFSTVTTNETSFFRDIKQLGVVKAYALKEILDNQEQKGEKQIRIWSAGCSSGEEPYTLAILLHEILHSSIFNWQIKILANDLSPTMIAKAKKGIYNEHSLRTTPEDIIKKYFSKEATGFKIHPKVQNLVQFETINLNNDSAVKRVLKSHIIFCRNVIIYFDEAMRKKVINAFYDNLLPSGYLILGHSESLHKYLRAFKPIRKPGGIIYQKKA